MRMRLQLGIVALVSCQSNPTVQGQLIGSFTFSAIPVSTDCSFVAIPALGSDGGFTFDAILSRDPSSTQAFMIVGSVQRNAGFDGQVFTSLAGSSRHFIECGSGCDPVPMLETLRVVLLSSSQLSAVGGSCPPNPLDGGIPLGSPDSGISPPCPSSNPCDVARACGELVDVVSPDGGSCQCSACTLISVVDGQKKASSP